VVEWCDFTLYLYFATVLSRVFFGGSDNPLLAMLATALLSLTPFSGRIEFMIKP
jgi:MHS family proline/betaine transporter-like MFS transporter